jgi:hypothetical protein
MEASNQLCHWGNYSQYPLNRRLDGHQSWFGHFREEKNFFLLLGFEPRVAQLVA